MVIMKKISGGVQDNLAFAVYDCGKNHTVQVFSGFRGIYFEHWKYAPANMDLLCLSCMAGSGPGGVAG